MERPLNAPLSRSTNHLSMNRSSATFCSTRCAASASSAGHVGARSCDRREGPACRYAGTPRPRLRTRTRCRRNKRCHRPPDVSRQGGANARPEDDDRDVGFGRARDLLLKRRGRQQRLVLPEQRLELQHITELRFEPADDTARDEALFGDIAGGRDEDTERLERHAANVRSGTRGDWRARQDSSRRLQAAIPPLAPAHGMHASLHRFHGLVPIDAR